jgi:Putative MetA-pathway of phenol degradation
MRLAGVWQVVAWAIAMAMGAGVRAEAQQRPLVTQDPEVIGDGRLLVESGLETGANVWYPVSGLTGDRVALPIGLSFGLGSVTEVQIDSGYQRLAIERRDFAPLDFRVHPGDHTSDVIDVTLAMKVRVLAEGARRPGLGLRFATDLPNASNESGLGLDTLNFSGTILVGKTIGAFRLVGNAGVALLSDVLQGSLQHDAFVGSVSMAYALRPSLDLVGELAGRQVLFADHPPIGAEPHGQARAAARYTRGRWRADAGVLVGTTRQAPDIGLSVGLTWISQVR